MRTIILLFALCISQLSHADAWDNLTIDEARSVVAELKENPYIFDYCDCCDHSGEYAASVHLLKVTGTEIITCSWSEEHYSVRITYEVIAALNYTGKGPNTKKLKKYAGDEVSDIVFMNYTWNINTDSHKATPFFNIVSYSTYGDSAPCKKEFAYPTPKAVSKVSDDKDYATWYAAHVN